MVILNDDTVNRLGMGVIGVVDDGCDSLVTINGGYEIMDFESKQSDEISMLAIGTIINDYESLRSKIRLVLYHSMK